jgi:alditol oxidase
VRSARQLHESGCALSNLPSLPHISVAGSVATATHGSGNANQSLASAVTAMSLITGTGNQVRLDHSSPDFAGAVVHLGALGVVTELTLTMEPTFEVRQDVLRTPAMGSADPSIRGGHGRRLQRQRDHRLCR